MESPLSILLKAQRGKVPTSILKYALGVAVIVELVVFTATKLQNDLRIAIVGTAIVIVLMVVLTIFSLLTSIIPKLIVAYPIPIWLTTGFYILVLLFTWFCVVLLMSIPVLLVTIYFFGYPRPIFEYTALEYISKRPITINPLKLYCSCHAGQTYCFHEARNCEEVTAGEKQCLIKYTNEQLFDISNQTTWSIYKTGWYANNCIL